MIRKSERIYLCWQCGEDFKGFLHREPSGCSFCHRADWIKRVRNVHYGYDGRKRSGMWSAYHHRQLCDKQHEIDKANRKNFSEWLREVVREECAVISYPQELIEFFEENPGAEPQMILTRDDGWIQVERVEGTAPKLADLEDGQRVGMGDGKSFHLRYTPVPNEDVYKDPEEEVER